MITSDAANAHNLMHRLDIDRPVRLAVLEHMFQSRRAEGKGDDVPERPAGEDAAYRQDDERPGHDRLALVSVRGRVQVMAVAMPMAGAMIRVERVLLVVNVRMDRLDLRGKTPRLAGEGQEPHPEHVESRQHRPHGREEEEHEVLAGSS